ncbi:MAG: DNA/RNA non-specific endonuclease [Porticoccaceae bacterium]|nr:DNA/RNA non-specific endonuclease [Porticoccaceae bacterium]
MKLDCLNHAIKPFSLKIMVLLVCLLISGGAISCQHLERITPKVSNFIDCRLGYAIGYNNELRSAEWVAYKLVRETSPGVERQNDFREDPEILEPFRTRPSDYNEPTYDMGHLANSESIDNTRVENSETFLMSNITPQLPGFNRAIWKGLENKERRLAERYGQVLVLTGPIYIAPFQYIGRAPIPTAFFKVIYFNETVEAYLIPHQALRTNQLQSYKVPVSTIKAITRLDL